MEKFFGKGVSRALRRLLNKDFVVFLAMSAGFWLMTALNETYEKEVSMPLSITNVPKNIIITDSISDTIRVTVRDKGYSLLPYFYGQNIKAIKLNFTNYAKSNGKGYITNAELQKFVRQQLYASTKIVSLKADKLEFYYNYGSSKRVPIIFDKHVKPSESFYLAETHIYPDSVTIYASKEKLDSILSVSTEEFNLDDFHDTLSTVVSLKSIQGVKMVPTKTKVRLFADMLTEQTITVPITTTNVPKGYILRTFPTTANVKVVVGRSKLSIVKPEYFLIAANYEEVASKHSDKCSLTLCTSPRGITRATLETTSVDYLIEKTE